MTTEENDYLLPYEEYLKNFRKTHHSREPAMSKDQYEAAKAKIEAQKKAAANEGKPNWWEQPGEAEKIVEKYTGKENPTKEEVRDAANEIVERRITPDQQGILSKGNQGENLNNPDALDTSEVTKLHNELKSMEQTKENMEPGTWSNTPEQVEEAKNEAGITKEVPGSTSVNNALTDSVAEVTTPNENDSPGVVNSKNNYNKSMMSIWDAYRAGEIDKETAGYFTIDAIATLAKNLGRSIGNVGAQFSGGTIDNGHDESKWGQRQNALLNETIGKDTESLGGAAGRQAESENIANLEARIRANYSPKMIDLEIENLENEIKKSKIDITKAENSLALIEYIKKDPDYTKNPVKLLLVGLLSQTGVGGAVNTGSSALEKLASLRGK